MYMMCECFVCGHMNLVLHCTQPLVYGHSEASESTVILNKVVLVPFYKHNDNGCYSCGRLRFQIMRFS